MFEGPIAKAVKKVIKTRTEAAEKTYREKKLKHSEIAQAEIEQTLQNQEDSNTHAANQLVSEVLNGKAEKDKALE